jgi:O-antigen/teichoic acid export membrane protein
VVAVSAFVQCLNAQMFDAWYADGRFRHGALIGAATASLGFVGLVVAGTITATPTAMILGSVAGEAVMATVSFTLLYRRRLVAIERTTVAEVAALVRLGWPSLSVLVGVIMVFRADRYIVGAFAGASAVTLYSLAATFSELARTVPQQLGQVFVRQVAGRAAGISLRRTVRLAVAAATLSGLAIALAGWIAIPVVFDRDMRDAREYLLLLVGAEVLFAPFFVASRGLVGGGWNRITGVIGAAGCVVGVISYFALVPSLGIVGACVGSAATYAGLSLATSLTLSRRLAGRQLVDAVRHTEPDALVPDAL